ncbi:ABC transporter permease subunit [Streptomyces sp. DSM 44917]|uniref:ABC transporter permease subunit n=1 Tax=Streptomyces boetiae TaxID=3075541 RepID=A0ABU2L945_9ACTN|nr:ABC transporter permease subunit [Streptomyces sp. DSM 44917]MDT0308084.1 ABC transporter permease subunit [Streptomyces sp. DSM 44917]
MRAALAAELLKIRTLRGTLWAAAAAVPAAAGPAALIGAGLRASYPELPADQRAGFDPLFAGAYPIVFAQLALVVLAVLAVGGEYASGTIRASLLAVPRRGAFYRAKVLAVALTGALAAAVTVPVSFLAGQAALGPYGVSPGAPGVPGALVGAWLYLTLITLFAAGFAALLRSPARALGVLLPLLFLGAQGLGNVPGLGSVLQYLPDQAGAVALRMAGPPEAPVFDRDFGPWTGLAILAAWAAAALAAGYAAVRRRDV